MFEESLRLDQGRASRASGDPRSAARKPRDLQSALGQVFTPAALADKMVCAIDLPSLGANPAILDPCVGPDTFPEAIRRHNPGRWRLDAIDVDQAMCASVSAVNDRRVEVHHIDYLDRPLQSYDAAILNPPYVRQEWITDKNKLAHKIKAVTGEQIPGTANLYVYFLVKVIAELRSGGRMACLVYDSWQSTLYGRWLRDHLDRYCDWTSEAITDCPFEGRLIDATIIYATKRKEPADVVNRAAGSALKNGRATIDDLFLTRRGLRLKQSNFFMASAERQAEEGSSQFIKKVGRIGGLTVCRNHGEAALLISPGQENTPAMEELTQRLAKARLAPDKNISILTWADERPDTWYLHPVPPKAPIIFNYFMRRRPKHIINPHGIAYSDNFYGLTPRSNEPEAAWFAALNSTASTAGIMSRARNQGAGLAKVQLFEYRSAPVVDIRGWRSSNLDRMEALGRTLAREPRKADKAIEQIDRLIAEVTCEPTLDPSHVAEEYALADHAAKRPGGVR